LDEKSHESAPHDIFNDFIAHISSIQYVDADILKSLTLEDINNEDIDAVSNDLGIVPLSSTFGNPLKYPRNGVVFGRGDRMFVAMSIRNPTCSDGHPGPWHTVLWLFDNGAPNSRIRADTLDALFPNSQPRRRVGNVEILGALPFCITQSSESFDNINLLGQDFMKSARMKVSMDYGVMTFQFDL
jgi:hypothetical protein